MKLKKGTVELLLANKGWSVSDLAKDANISSRTYYTGIKSGISPKQVGKIAKSLNARVEDIIVKED